LPFKDFEENVDLISNLLKQETIKDELRNNLQLKRKDLYRFQRIKFMMQRKDTATIKSLEKMVDEGTTLANLCEAILQRSTPRREPITSETARVISRIPVTTGYEDLDDLLVGGIPENYAVILTSPSCDERDLLIERFLEAGAKEGQTVFHVTIDASRLINLVEEFQSNFYLFICNPEADSIVKDLPNVFKLNGVENLTEMGIALSSAFRKLDRTPKLARRVCLEIVSDVLLQHQALSTRRWLAALIPRFKSRGFTALAVMNPHMHSSQEVEAILDLFEGEIDIYKKKTEKGLRRFLKISKMYNQEYIERELLLKKDRM